MTAPGRGQTPPPPCPESLSNGRTLWLCEKDEGHEGDHSFWRDGPKGRSRTPTEGGAVSVVSQPPCPYCAISADLCPYHRPVDAHADYCPVNCVGGCDDCLGQLGCTCERPR